eukprot:TRINITY_DN10037_c0_g2_i2.p1 TRINITY_DN10037_c0_g2~~TRINITY_DN10037_c0_g2_i2.p1  ORF type:complete len:180 (+),score=37.03 TRINITY_DN10037_c0_g2_i2:120-659(+)
MYGTECKSCHKCHWQRPKPKPSAAPTEEECSYLIGAAPSVMYSSVLESVPVEVQQSGFTRIPPLEQPFGGSDTLGQTDGSSCRKLLRLEASLSGDHGASERAAAAQSRGRPALAKQVRSVGPQLGSRSFPQFQDSAQWFKKSHMQLMQREMGAAVHVWPASVENVRAAVSARGAEGQGG